MASGSPDYFPRMITTATEEEQEKADVTDAETTVTFSAQVKAFLIYNNGPFNVHYSLSAGVGTDNFVIPSGAGLMMDLPTTNIYFICASGETATIYVVGVR